MKKVLVVSDTHMPKKASSFPSHLIKYLNNIDLIIHSGDISKIEILETLKKFAPVEAVHGNIDDEQIKSLLPYKRILHIEDITIGIIHGHGKSKNTVSRAIDAFKNEIVNIIIFGHSHIPFKKQIGDILLFNPGSPTDKRRQNQFSFGILEIDKDHFSIVHVFFK